MPSSTAHPAPARHGPAPGHPLPWSLCLAVVVALAAVGAGSAARTEAAATEQVISFSGVAVEGAEGAAEAPEVAHLDPLPGVVPGGAPDEERTPYTREFAGERGYTPGFAGERASVYSRQDRALDIALDLRLVVRVGDPERYVYVEKDQRLGFGREAALDTLTKFPHLVQEIEAMADRIRPEWRKRPEKPTAAPSLPVPLNPREFAPGQAIAANPSFVEGGFRVEAFWAVRTGTPAGQFLHAHFHPPNLVSGFEAQHLGNRNELHGLHIRSVDGRPFWLKRLRCRVTLNRQLPSKAYSIDGYNNFSVQVLVARAFDPRRSVREQFLGFPVGIALGNDPTLPWQTLQLFGFEFVKEVYIASSASVDIDDIAVIPLAAAP